MARFDPSSTASGEELSPRAGDASATIHVPTSASYYEAAIEGLTALNERMLRSASFPAIYESGVGYRKESEDTWRHADDVLCSGWGDCEDLAAWRAAELRVSGEDPGARVYVYRSGPLRFHAVVARGDHSIEDPSLILGMVVSQERRAQLPKYEGDTEMSDTQPREFAACTGSCTSCPNRGTVGHTGEDILSRGAVGNAGATLLDNTPNVGFGWGSIGRAVRGAVTAPMHMTNRIARLARRAPGARFLPQLPGNMVGTEDDDGGSGQTAMDGIDEDDQGCGDDGYDDGSQYGYDDGSQYPQDDGSQYQQPAPPPGPSAMDNAMTSAGQGIKSAASDAWNVTKNIFSPIKSGVQLAVAPIHLVAEGSKKIAKWGMAPVNAARKLFSFLGSDEVLPHQVQFADDDAYNYGDEDIFESHPDDIEPEDVPVSQKPRWETFQDPTTGGWHGQVTLPTTTPGKSFALTSTAAPDESSAADRMFNLTKKAADSPALMAMLNPIGFSALMLTKAVKNIPFAKMFSATGGGIATAARAVGRGAETIARAATDQSW